MSPIYVNGKKLSSARYVAPPVPSPDAIAAESRGRRLVVRYSITAIRTSIAVSAGPDRPVDFWSKIRRSNL